MTFGSRKKKKNSHSNRHYGLWAIAIVCFLAIGTIIAGGVMLAVVSSNAFLSDSINHTGEDALEPIERTLGARPPDSAQNIHYYYTSWLDYYLRIRVDMPPDDVIAYIDQMSITCLQTDLQADIMAFRTAEGDADWWRPSHATVYSGVSQCGGNPFWSLMIDQSDDAMWTLYVESFSA